MKKAITIIFSVLLVMTIATGIAFAAGAPETGGDCGDNATWNYDGNGTLTISGTGDMYNYEPVFWSSTVVEDSVAPWKDYKDAITKVVIEKGIETIGDGDFYYLTKLEEVSLPSTLERIGKNAFRLCTKLSSLTLPSSLEAIGELAFYHADSLPLVQIPENTTTIGDNAFASCDSLTEFIVTANNQAYTTIDGVLFNKDLTVLMQYPSGKSGSYAIPEGIVTVKTAAFEEAGELTALTIPASVNGISNFIFTRKMEEIVVASGNEKYKSVDGVLFSKDGKRLIYYPANRSGSTYSIPEGTEDIVSFAFHANQNLTKIVLPESIVGGIQGMNFSYIIKYPANTITIEHATPTKCGDDAKWSYSEGVLRIYGTGATDNYYCAESRPWQQYAGNITKIVVGEGISKLGDYAFTDLKFVETVELPDTLGEMGESLFAGCSRLTSINIPRLLIFWPDRFSGCYNLTNITIDESSNYELRNNSIQENKDLIYALPSNAETFVVPENMEVIFEYAFINMPNLKSIFIPKSAVGIVGNAFDTTQLDTIYYEGTKEEWSHVILSNSYSDFDLTEPFVVYNSQPEYLAPVEQSLYAKTKEPTFSGGMGGGYGVFTNVKFYESNDANTLIEGESALNFPEGAGTFTYTGNGSWTWNFTNATEGCYKISLVSNPDKYVWCFVGNALNNESATMCLWVEDFYLAYASQGAPTRRLSFYDREGNAFKLVTDTDLLRFPNDAGTFTYENGFWTWDHTNAKPGAYDVKYYNGPNLCTFKLYVHDSGMCGDNARYSFNASTGTLTISGTGAMQNYEYVLDNNLWHPNTPWCKYREKITRIVVEEGITAIGINAFCECGNVESVSMPDSLGIIMGNAFKGLSKIETFTIPKNVYFIAQSFYECESLKQFVVVSGNTHYMTSYGVLFTSGMKTLISYPAASVYTDYEIPYGVESIEPFAFSKCNRLRTITIPSSVRKFEGPRIVEYCNNLEKVNYKGTEAEWNQIERYTPQGSYSFSYPNEVNIAFLRNEVPQYNFIVPSVPKEDDQIKLRVRSAFGKINSDGLVEVPLYMESNPGIITMRLGLEYDVEALEFVSAENGKIFRADSFTNATAGYTSLFWVDESAPENYTGTGLLAKLYFKPLTQDTGRYTVNLTYNDATNLSLEKVSVGSYGGQIILNDFIFGDLNNDEEVDEQDLLAFRYYLAGYQDYQGIIQGAADVNRDGTVCSADYLILAWHLDGKAGYEELPYGVDWKEIVDYTVKLEGFPDKPVTIVCPYSAPGGAATMCGIIADYLSDRWGVEVNVVEKNGGSGTIGTAYLASAQPDGYTIGLSSYGAMCLSPQPIVGTDYYFDDIVPIAQVTESYPILSVSTDHGSYQTWNEFVSAAQANAGTVEVVTSGWFGSNHISLEELSMALTDNMGLFKHVFENGGNAARTAVLAGSYDAILSVASEQSDYYGLQNGGLTPILQLTSKLSSETEYPNIPTCGDLGININTGSFYMVCCQKDVPAAVVAFLEQELAACMADPTVKAQFEAAYNPVAYLNAADAMAKYTAKYQSARQIALALENPVNASLPAPTGLNWYNGSNRTYAWNDVNGAAGYLMQYYVDGAYEGRSVFTINGYSAYTRSVPIDLYDESFGNLTLKLAALKQGQLEKALNRTLDESELNFSAISTSYVRPTAAMTQVTNLRWDPVSPVVTWDAVSGASGYYVSYLYCIQVPEGTFWMQQGSTMVDTNSFNAGFLYTDFPYSPDVVDVAVNVRTVSPDFNITANSLPTDFSSWKGNPVTFN